MCLCVCVGVAVKDKKKASSSVVSRGRGGTMSAQAAPPCPGGGAVCAEGGVAVQERSWAGGQGHRACYCLANRTLGGHQSLRSPCPLSIRLGLRLCSDVASSLSPQYEIKAREGSPQSTSPWGTFVRMFRDLLSLNNTLQ